MSKHTIQGQFEINMPTLSISLAKVMMVLILIVASTLYSAFVFNIGSWGNEGDIGVYQLQFSQMLNLNSLYIQTDPGFYGLMLLFARLFDFPSFLVSCYFLFFLSLISPIYKMSTSAVLAVFFFVICFFYPSYNSLTELVLRQGVGFSVLFFMSFYFNAESKLMSLVKVMLASLFHATFLFYIPVLIAVWSFKRLSTISFIWLIIAILYAANIPLTISEMLPAEIKFFYRAAFATDTDFTLGFKPLFLILSALPMLCLTLGAYYREVKQNKALLNVYQIFIVANGIAMLFSGIPYYDRVMMFSWVLVPFIGVSFFSFLLARTRV
jgi:hypothetical protein